VLSLGATGLKRLLKADDSWMVFGIHGVGGIVGAILTGVFAQKTLSGAEAHVGDTGAWWSSPLFTVR
jgi:Amt family ammonium transporter